MSAKYAWIIDKDRLVEDGTTNESEVGTCGPSDPFPGLIESLQTNIMEGEKFVMFDDDGTPYYEGRITGKYDGFEPLYDFGMPNAGCTLIAYVKKDGTLDYL